MSAFDWPYTLVVFFAAYGVGSMFIHIILYLDAVARERGKNDKDTGN